MCNTAINIRKPYLVLLLLASLLSTPTHSGPLDKELVSLSDTVVSELNNLDTDAIAVVDFMDLQGTTTEFGRYIAEELSTNIVVSERNFDVIDRSNLSRLIKELKLQNSGLVDPDNVKRLGNMAGASALVIGTYTPLENQVRVTAKVISTDTARILAAARSNIDITSPVKDLLRTRVVGNRDTSDATREPNESATSKRDSKPKLINETEHYTVTVRSASYDKVNNLITVSIDYRNREEWAFHCLALPEEDAVFATTSQGHTWTLKKAMGLKTARPDPNASFSGANWIGTFYKVNTGGSHRFNLVLETQHKNAALTMDLSVSLLQYSLATTYGSCGSRAPSQISLGFDGVSASF